MDIILMILFQHIWTPDVIIHDLVRFNKPEILNQVDSLFVSFKLFQVGALEIFRDKRVYYKVRSDITIVCKAMEFALYPLDNHKCYLILTSCKYNFTSFVSFSLETSGGQGGISGV